MHSPKEQHRRAGQAVTSVVQLSTEATAGTMLANPSLPGLAHQHLPVSGPTLQAI